MAIKVSDTGGGDFKMVPQGTHIAVCNQVVDVGMQVTNFGPKHKVFLRWEIPAERIQYGDGNENEGPMVIGKFYTASLNEKANLRQDLEAWRGRAFTEQELAGFDLDNVLGAPCQISVVHNESNGKTYANVRSVTALPKGVDKPQPELELIKYGPEDQEQFDKLPDWLKKKIQEQPPTQDEEADAVAETADDDGLDDDIPF